MSRSTSTPTTQARTSRSSARLRRPLLVLIAVALAVIPLAVAVWLATESDSSSRGGRDTPTAASIIDAVTSVDVAGDPFPGLTETTVSVGDERLRVVLADAPDERSQGLRRRETLGPYDGMLFVYLEPVETSFTMSTVPVPLDIAFYGADGRVVSRLRMEPCAGTEAECPLYRPGGEFVYALETLADELPRGRLAG